VSCQKNLKTFVYLGAALLVIVAALFSSSGKKTPAQQASGERQPPQPALAGQHRQQRAGLKNQLQAERQKRTAGDNGRRCDGRFQPLASCDAPAAIRSRSLWADRPCRALHSWPALPAAQQSNMQMQLTPVQQQGTVDRCERTERADNSRFRFPIFVYSRSADPPQQQQQQGQNGFGPVRP